MKIFKKVLGFCLAASLAVCSAVSFVACSDGSGSGSAAPAPLTEEEKVALRSELQTVLEAEEPAGYHGLTLNAETIVTANKQTYNIGLEGAVAVPAEGEIGADLYITVPAALATMSEAAGPATLAGGMFLRGGTVYLTESQAPTSEALKTGITAGTLTLLSLDVSDLGDIIGGIGGGDTPVFPGDGDTDSGLDGEEDSVMQILLTVAAQLPELAENAEAMLNKELAGLGTADRTEEGYALTITSAEILDKVKSEITTYAAILDACGSRKLTEVFDVPQVKEAVETLFKDVTVEELHSVICKTLEAHDKNLSDMLGDENVQKLADCTTVTEYIKTFVGFMPVQTFGELVAQVTQEIYGTSMTLTQVAIQVNAILEAAKKVVDFKLDVRFDNQKQLVGYAFDVTVDTSTLSAIGTALDAAVKVQASVLINLEKTTPVLLDLSGANVKEYGPSAPVETPDENLVGNGEDELALVA